MPELIRGAANLLLNWHRRNCWRFHPARFRNLTSVPIDRPIFLLGLQGGGLTLVSRMLRRHPAAVSVTGNHRFWPGPDEMQNVMGPFLPPDLSGLHYHIPPHYGYPRRDGLYAIDELLHLYRRTARDATQELSHRLCHAIRIALFVNTENASCARFVDKSQTFTVRLGFVNRLLQGHCPHFLLVTRNPYAHCLRAASRMRSLLDLNLPMLERLKLAAQHWVNSVSCALKDAEQVAYFSTVRFEDMLARPESTLQRICDDLELPFHEEMLPRRYHQFPLGSVGSSRGDKKWYPLRPDVNKPYLEDLEPWMIPIIERRAGVLAARFSYTPNGDR